MNDHKGIMLALDNDLHDALKLVREVGQYVSYVKVGNHLLLKHGLEVVRQLKNITSREIIADLKIMDQPYFARKLAKLAYDNACDGVVICGSCGPTAIRSCIELDSAKKLFVFTEFTHPDGLIDHTAADEMAAMARDLGAYGIQVPGSKPTRIECARGIVGQELKIICCGIGTTGSPPGTAIRYGADFEIIGRAIYESENPAMKAKEISELIHRISAIQEEQQFKTPIRGAESCRSSSNSRSGLV